MVKFASACHYFTESILADLLPYKQEAQQIPLMIGDLVDAGIFRVLKAPHIPASVQKLEPSATTFYSFASKLLQRQANRLLLHEQREALDSVVKKVRNFL